MKLDFPTRVAILTRTLAHFLRQYRQPEHLDESGVKERMQMMAEAINNRISGSLGREDLEARLEMMCREVTATYRGRDWPTAAHFIGALDVRAPEAAADTDWSLDPVKIAADRISDGEPVGDGWLWGRQAVDLLRSGKVTTEQIRPYRQSHAAKLRKLYGDDEAERMLAHLNRRHEDAARAQ